VLGWRCWCCLQEADCRKISCRPERRAEFAEELRDSILDALNLLSRWGWVVEICFSSAAAAAAAAAGTCCLELAAQQQQVTEVWDVAQ
jgi:hypothetical protein